MGKTAIIIGSSGLVGNKCLQLLLADSNYTKVVSLVRKSSGISNEKLVEYIIDFENINDFKDLIKGDDAFCCLGTTINKAKSKSGFYKVDFSFCLEFAKIAKQNGCSKFLIVSSMGAKARSSNFYLHVKGSLEEALRVLNFQTIYILRPSMLLGNREEFRFGELVGKFFMQITSFLMVGPLLKYKAVHADKVAEAMISLALKNEKGIFVVESDMIQQL